MAREGGKDRGLFERPKGSGIWWIRYADATGKERKEKVGSKSAARMKYISRKEEARMGVKLPENLRSRALCPTVSQLIDHYLPDIRATKRTYREDERFADYWKAFIGSVAIDEVNATDLRRYREQRQDLGNAPATVNRQTDFLKKLYNRAIKDLSQLNAKSARRDNFFGDLKTLSNPFICVPDLEENNTRMRYLKPAELVSLMKAYSEQQRYQWLSIEFALHTGMRAGNQCSLPKSALDLANSCIVITRETKNRDILVIPLNPLGVECCRELLNLAGDSPWLFPNGKGSHLGLWGLRHRLRAGCERAGISDFKWHDLRHSTASWMAQSGVQIKTIAEHLGHKSLSVTARYAKLSPEHRLQAAGTIAGVLDKANTTRMAAEDTSVEPQEPPVVE